MGLLFVTAVLWSLGGLLIKKVEWNPMAIAGGRSAIAAVVLLPFVRRANFAWSTFQLGGAIAYAITVILFVLSNRLTTAANTIFLQYTSPVYVALFSAWFLGEKPRWFDWTCIAAVVGGVCLFFLDDLSAGGRAGNWTALAGGAAFGAFVLFMRKQKDEHPLECVFIGNVLAAVVCAPFMIGPAPDAQSLATLFVLGAVQIGVAYICFSAAIRHVTAIEANLIPAIEPILNPLWVFMFIGERPGQWAFVGGTIVLISVIARAVVAARTATIEQNL